MEGGWRGGKYCSDLNLIKCLTPFILCINALLNDSQVCSNWMFHFSFWIDEIFRAQTDGYVMRMTNGCTGVQSYCRIHDSGRDIKRSNYSINGGENVTGFKNLGGDGDVGSNESETFICNFNIDFVCTGTHQEKWGGINGQLDPPPLALCDTNAGVMVDLAPSACSFVSTLSHTEVNL